MLPFVLKHFLQNSQLYVSSPVCILNEKLKKTELLRSQLKFLKHNCIEMSKPVSFHVAISIETFPA